jgi:Flp pilus assembly protein TadG
MTSPPAATPLARSFLRQDAGTLSVIMGLSFLPMMGFVGAAIDYSRASALRADLQGAADAAAVAGAGHLAAGEPRGETAETVARRVIEGMVGTLPTPPDVDVDSASRTVSVVVSAESQTAFMQILRITTIPVAAQAAARFRPALGPPVCFHALVATGTAINGVGPRINAAPCITWINSTSTPSVNLVGSSITSLRNCLAGGAPVTGMTPPAERCAARPDPYAGTTPALPAATQNCSRASAYNIVTQPAQALPPCIYNGGINIVG